jgi:hypothetical protein
MADDQVIMPNGTPFPFWDDTTDYTRVYHVAQRHPDASDDAAGTEDAPFATIGRAAAVLQPGEKVVVHEGTYREWVHPARGGTSAQKMIAYEAVAGEAVLVKGSEVWAGPFRPSEGWRRGRGGGDVPIWMGDLPPEWAMGYNPFLADNMPAEYRTFVQDWSAEETQRFQLRRGLVFAGGRLLTQVFWYRDLAQKDGAYWVEDDGTRIHFRLPDDADPAEAAIEVTTRGQAFAPSEYHLGYIRVSGFRFEHCADPIPIPQRAMVSTTRGHHWIIEDNDIRHANACAVDIGRQSWHTERADYAAGHIVRGNHMADCGESGIQGCGGVDDSLIEDNVIERIGGRVPERIFECGGIKLHTARGVLIRRNVFRHIRDACGLWLDYLNANCRVTRNVFADIATSSSAVYIEVSHELNAVDHNVMWDVRSTKADRAEPGTMWIGGIGISGDTGEHLVVAHNLLGQIRHNYAVSFDLMQWGRVVGGRTGLGVHQHALNNVFVECPCRIVLGRRTDNESPEPGELAVLLRARRALDSGRDRG